MQPIDLAELIHKLRLFNLSSLVWLGSLLITLSSIVSGRAMLINLHKRVPSFNFLKISFVSGSTGNFSLASGSLANNLLISVQ